MKNQDRSIRVIAENNYRHDGFNIYLEFSGKREYLMSHRHNAFIFDMLKHGPRLAELRKKTKMHQEKIRHLLKVIDEYILDREAA